MKKFSGSDRKGVRRIFIPGAKIAGFFMKSIKRSMIMIIVLSIFVPMLFVMVITYRAASASAIESYKQSSNESLAYVADNFSNFFKGIDDIGLDIYFNPTLFSNLKGASQELSPAAKKFNENWMKTYFSHNENIASMRYISFVGNYSLQYEKKPGRMFYYSINDPETESYFADAYYTPVCVNDFRNQKAFYFIDSEGVEYLTYCRMIYALPQKTAIGELSIIMETDGLENTALSYISKSEEAMFVYSYRTKECLYTNASNELLADITPLFDKGAENSGMVIDSGSEQWLTMCTSIPAYDISVFKAIPYSSLNSDVRAYVMKTILPYIIICIAILILVSLFSRAVIRPINKLRTALTSMKNEGNYSPIELGSGNDNEIYGAIRDFNSMARQIDTLVNEQLKSEIAVREAQLCALQATINPHFITNTLQTVGLMAVERNAYDIKFMLDVFCNMIRYVISGDIRTATVKQEMEYVKDYLIIQKLRLSDRMDFSVQCMPEAENLKIPKISIQPLVENAIQHGFGGKGEVIRVEVSAEYRDEILTIIIKDNGAGFSCDIDGFMKSIEENVMPMRKDRFGGIGIVNVNSRIRLMYGDRYSFEITSCGEFKTCIRITIRMEGKEENQ